MPSTSPGLSTEPAKKIIQFTSRIRLRRDPAGWTKPSSEHAAPTGRCSLKQGARCPPVTPAPTRGATPTGRYFSAKCHQDQLRVRATWEWSWSNVRKPDTRFPPASRLIARALGAARCFSRARIARSAAAITHGLRGRPGSTSRASGCGAATRAPGVIDTDQVIAIGGYHGAHANLG